jgi:hypothetical protein
MLHTAINEIRVKLVTCMDMFTPIMHIKLCTKRLNDDLSNVTYGQVKKGYAVLKQKSLFSGITCQITHARQHGICFWQK